MARRTSSYDCWDNQQFLHSLGNNKAKALAQEGKETFPQNSENSTKLEKEKDNNKETYENKRKKHKENSKAGRGRKGREIKNTRN